MSTLILIAALMSGLLAGVFFAFSSFVMPALSALPAPEAIRSMQRINVDVFCWSFVWLFFGTPLLAMGLAAYGATHWADPRAPYLLAAAGLLLFGAMLVTGRGNVPLNDRLARVDSHAEDASARWRSFYAPWMRWNHLRLLASAAAACVLIVALLTR